MKIPFFRINYDEKELEAIKKVIASGWLTTGNENQILEDNFIKFTKGKYAVALSSCTAAILLSLRLLNIKKGDEVIVPSITFVSAVNSIIEVGAIPIFADICPDTWCLSYETVKLVVSNKTKAIVPTHYAGFPIDRSEIKKMIDDFKVNIIEDCAHAVAAYDINGHVGNDSNFACFSFYATKNISAGEGGMLLTDDKEIADQAASLRLHGLTKEAWKRYISPSPMIYDVLKPGYKMNLTDLNAIIAKVQLEKLPQNQLERERITKKYFDEINNLPITLPPMPKSGKHAYHLFPILLNSPQRDQIAKKLSMLGVSTSHHFIPVDFLSYYSKNYKRKDKSDFFADKFMNHQLSLPLFPGLTEEEQDYVISSLKNVIKG